MLNVLSVVGVLSLQPSVPLQRPGAPAPSPVVAPISPTEPAEATAPEPSVEAPAAEAPVDEAPSEAMAPARETAVDAEDASAEAAPTIAMPIPVDEPAPPEPVIDIDRHDRSLRRANTVLAAGAVIATFGGLMAIGAATEAGKAPCKFDLETCPNAPRRNVTRGLAAGAAIAIVGGGVLVVTGVVKRRRIQTRIAADLRSAGVVLVGRF